MSFVLRRDGNPIYIEHSDALATHSASTMPTLIGMSATCPIEAILCGVLLFSYSMLSDI
jgi:hypothetical protein